jgi:hypothetical protein
MTQRVDPTEIEKIVGVERDLTLHYGRAVSDEQMVYILHSKICLDTYSDLRKCPFSLALDRGILEDEWLMDRPLPLTFFDGRLVPM